MFTFSDASVFREQILANASFLFREEHGAASAISGGSRKHDIVVRSGDGSNYIAMLVNYADGKALLESGPDPNPAGAIHQLFDETADQLARVLKTSTELKAEQAKADKAAEEKHA